jgi:hypothetical protein
MITGPGTFIVEVGELAATVLTSSALTTVKTSAWTSPQYSGSVYPTTGQLQIIATAVSAGSSVNNV